MTYSYLDAWRAIAGQIRGIVGAAHLHSEFLAIKSRSSYGRSDQLREQCCRLIEQLETFRETLPAPMAAAKATIDRFIAANHRLAIAAGNSRDAREEMLWTVLVALAGFEAEVSFLLLNPQPSIKARTERAFIHLQRSIVVDSEVRSKWQQAYRSGEVQCEKLGAVHLLMHGIWAFKVDAQGARTDLVLQEPVETVSDVQIAADGLVLTEWKIASGGADSSAKWRQAKIQAQKYAEGALAASELNAYRYLVLVTENAVNVPADEGEDGISYRHIDIAVDPKPPSRMTR